MSRADESLVERAAQLAVLEWCWSAVTSSQRGHVLVIGGESGAGKTALVHPFRARVPADVPVYVGAGDALHTARPLGPFQDVARPGGPLQQAIERAARPYEVASAVLAELADRVPAVVVLEDMHWADEASLDVLRLLARRLDAHAVLIVVTFRDDEVGAAHSFRILLGELSASTPTNVSRPVPANGTSGAFQGFGLLDTAHAAPEGCQGVSFSPASAPVTIPGP